MLSGILNSDIAIFQFHYGTIKSCRKHIEAEHVAEFQFHYGTIKRMPKLTVPHGLLLFQFHYGTIKSLMLHLTKHVTLISIPLWYD